MLHTLRGSHAARGSRAVTCARRRRFEFALLGAFVLCGANPAAAGTYVVPSAQYPSLQSAVGAAAASADAQNEIHVGGAPLFTSAVVTITNAFHENHRLVIRPVPGMNRAFIASQNGSERIFDVQGATNVRFQDLDIVRFSTNDNDLMFLDGCTDVLIERCRIGSIWTSVGSAGPWGNIVIRYPINVVIRNCMVFSHRFGNFDYGITASLGDDSNSLKLYNNDIADHSQYGVEISAHIPGELLVLRNNLVMNHRDAAIEPVAFHSAVGNVVTVQSSHNVAFAAAGNVETIDGDLDISGLGGATFKRISRDRVDDSFVKFDWDVLAGWNPNANRDFYRLLSDGELHDHTSDYGLTDAAIPDDWERQPRPTGAPTQHTDRGADQVVSNVGVESAVTSRSGLWAAPRLNPTSAVAIRFESESPGRLELEVFDLGGRRMHRESRDVAAGASGLFEWAGPGRGQVLQYRLRLAGSGAPVTRTGRVVVLP
ncbi:MAG: right-handed parallel beta-helix repeat-containing protein [Candidatus Eisenbacteria bacterium]|uniref:Right-handed parallel beta-helix repeat-containing protein n=1 Tax=Eiseniibacteriota bacterium TaxID=2212470 RepID=A0A849SGD6_UNCEI|nr:right-handed parallel beta-helix repeat-containing protein [Candidatus Eisenbacteria bacterium]